MTRTILNRYIVLMEKLSRKVTPAILEVLPVEIASGKPQGQIALENNLSRKTVNQYASKPDIRAKIEAIQARLANEAYTAVADNLIGAVKAYKTLKGDTPETMQRRDHGFKASVKVAESMGILPSHSQSILVQQVFNTQNNFISPNVARLLEIADADIIEED